MGEMRYRVEKLDATEYEWFTLTERRIVAVLDSKLIDEPDGDERRAILTVLTEDRT